MMRPLGPPLVGRANSAVVECRGHKRCLSPRSCCLRLPQPRLRAAGTHNFDLLLLPLALFSSCCCRPPHQATTADEGPNGTSAGLEVASCASRELVGPAGFASSISLVPAAEPWLSGEPFGFPFSC
jgi:hypothetical protein